jgi:hypothetical protein
MTVNIYDMAQTWNDGATTFTGIKLNVTDTASASGSLLMDLQVGGVSRVNAPKTGEFLRFDNGGYKIRSGGTFLCFGNSSPLAGFDFNTGNLQFVSGGEIGWTSSGTYCALLPDLRLNRDAANTLALRNGVNAQAFNIYNTYTSASHYERGFMRWSGNALQIGVEAAGGGSTRVVHISNLPTSNPGVGILWNNAGTPAIGT